MLQGLHQPQHIVIPPLGVDLGAALHDMAHFPLGQLLGGVFSGEHQVDQDAHGVDVAADVRLGQAVLLGGGKADGAQDLGVVLVLRLVKPGGVKVQKHRLGPAQDDMLGLDVPMDRTDGVEHPQGPAHLGDDLFGLRRGKEGVLHQKTQGVPLYVFLQDQILLALNGHLIHGGEIGAGVV